MPKGHYNRAIRRLSLQEFLLYLLRLEGGPRYASDLYDRVRHRGVDRRDFYQIMRGLEREGRVQASSSVTGGTVYQPCAELEGEGASDA